MTPSKSLILNIVKITVTEYNLIYGVPCVPFLLIKIKQIFG